MILALLMRWPMHGYLIASVLNDMVGPHARVSNGRLYPLLAKLEATGLIEAETASGERGQRTFHITPEGRLRFRHLAMDTELSRADYPRLFWTKFAFFGLLEPDERLFITDHYLNYCKAHIFHLTREAEDLQGRLAGEGFMSPESLEAILFSMRHDIARWRLEVESVETWRQQHPEG